MVNHILMEKTYDDNDNDIAEFQASTGGVGSTLDSINSSSKVSG